MRLNQCEVGPPTLQIARASQLSLIDGAVLDDKVKGPVQENEESASMVQAASRLSWAEQELRLLSEMRVSALGGPSSTSTSGLSEMLLGDASLEDVPFEIDQALVDTLLTGGVDPLALVNILKDALGEVWENLRGQLKPLLAFFQINASFELNFVIPFPLSVSEIWSIFSLFSVDFIWDLIDRFNVTVDGAVNYANMTLFMMTAFASFLAGLYMGIIVLCRTALRHNEERREAFYDMMVQLVVVLLFLLHPVLSLRLIKLFHMN
eukprot:7387690-Prymnesium_polylepis.1